MKIVKGYITVETVKDDIIFEPGDILYFDLGYDPVTFHKYNNPALGLVNSITKNMVIRLGDWYYLLNVRTGKLNVTFNRQYKQITLKMIKEAYFGQITVIVKIDGKKVRY